VLTVVAAIDLTDGTGGKGLWIHAAREYTCGDGLTGMSLKVARAPLVAIPSDDGGRGLRVGEVIELNDDQERLLVGQPIPGDVCLIRRPDRDGRFVAIMLAALDEGGMERHSRVTFE
jgi:hypothetical protein